MAKPLRAAPLSAKLHSGRFPNFGELMRRRNARRILPVSASTVHHPTPCEPSLHCSSHLSAGRTWSRDHRDATKRWFPEEMEQWLPLIEAKEQEIWKLAAAPR